MKEILRLALVLTAICVVAAAALAQIYKVTAGPIAHQKRMEMLRAIEAVLPAHDNEPDRDTYASETQGDEARTFYIGRQGSEVTGSAFRVSDKDGYGGSIEAIVGVDPAGAVSGVRILDHRETPGLGNKIAKPWFLDRIVFKDPETKKVRRTLENTDWRVKKDGGEIDQITGATISPRSLVRAVSSGLQDFGDNREQILAAAPPSKDDGTTGQRSAP